MKQILHDITVLFTHMIITVDFFCSILGQVRDLLLSRFGATDRMFLVVFQGDPELQNSAVFFQNIRTTNTWEIPAMSNKSPLWGTTKTEHFKKKRKMGMRWGESEAITIITIVTIVGWTSICKLMSAWLGTRVLNHSQITPQAANTRNNHVWISSWNLLIFSTSTCLTISWMGKLNTI